MGVFLPIGEQQAHLDFTQRHSLPQAGHHGAAQAAVLGGRLAEADIDGVYLLNGGQVREFVLVGKCPFRHQRAAHAAGDGRFHPGVFQIQAGLLQRRGGGGIFRPGPVFLRHGLLVLPHADGALGHQGGIAGGLVLRIRQHGLGARYRGLAFVQHGLERSRIYLEEKVARADRLPFLVAAFLNDSRHAGAHFRLEVRLHAAGKVGGYGNLGAVHRENGHFRHDFSGRTGGRIFIPLPAGGESCQKGGAEKKETSCFHQ